MKKKDLYEENYIDFAHAIIKQLVKDYRRNLQYSMKFPDLEKPKKELEKMESFVHSYLFGLIVTMEPKQFIKLMRESVWDENNRLFGKCV